MWQYAMSYLELLNLKQLNNSQANDDFTVKTQKDMISTEDKLHLHMQNWKFDGEENQFRQILVG